MKIDFTIAVNELNENSKKRSYTSKYFDSPQQDKKECAFVFFLRRFVCRNGESFMAYIYGPTLGSPLDTGNANVDKHPATVDCTKLTILTMIFFNLSRHRQRVCTSILRNQFVLITL